jgi:AcrR family transcriptional regulator
LTSVSTFSYADLMPDGVLTREQVIDAAEDVLRRFGPAKSTVIDVARALGVSHGSVYRHFATKADLRDAVAAQSLARLYGPLEAVAHKDKPAARRLKRWIDKLASISQAMAIEEPELFATFRALALESHDVVVAHAERLGAQIEEIIVDGVTRAEFVVPDTGASARAVWDATARFHHPAFAAQWADADLSAQLDAVWQLLLRGLVGGADRPRRHVELVRGPHAVHGPLAYRP